MITRTRFSLVSSVALLVCASAALAGGPHSVTADGKPIVWPNGGRDIVIYAETGNLGPLINADAVAQTQAASQRWNEVPRSTARISYGGSLGVDVDVTNFGPYLDGTLTDKTQIIYDGDGAIFDLLFGPGNVIDGFAFADIADSSSQFFHGTVFLNGGAIDRPFEGLSVEEFLGVQVHELGHLLGLDHTIVNGELATVGDTTGPSPNETFAPPATAEFVETMYAFIIPGGGQGTLDMDDRTAIAALYPDATFRNSTGAISGGILDIDGRTPLNGVNVIARNIADPIRDSVQDFSGRLAGFDPSNKNPTAGRYTLRGLTPGARYAVFVDQISAGQFSVPLTTIPGPEEFFNGTAETDNFNRLDPPNEYTPITAQAGNTRSGINVIFNRVRPGQLALTSLIERERPAPWLPVLLPFPFEMCGTSYDRVFLDVTSGSVTFGSPEPIFFTPQTPTFLRGAPRVAALMTFFEPDPFSDVMFFEQTSQSVTFRSIDIPEFGVPFGKNTFAISLLARTPQLRNRARISYGRMDAPSGVAGYSCGNDVASGFEPETDLSQRAGEMIDGKGKPAIFEEFGNVDQDLSNRLISFELPGRFRDEFEPNNSLFKAQFVTLPFNTARRFADVDFADADYFRFFARAGETLVAETVGGKILDTQLELFDGQGTPVAASDDTGFSLFSRVIYSVPRSGLYTIAVSLAPPSKFPGFILPTGRYALTVSSYTGTVLSMGDDTTANVPLRFAFPFQGKSWKDVWVSSNGSLTFGAPERVNVFSDIQLPGFLAGPPRIAPFMTDLDPSGLFNGIPGLVIVDGDRSSLTVNWVSVPKIFDLDTNTASVVLRPDGSIKMNWGPALGPDQALRGLVVGVTQGNGASDPGLTDLSAMGTISPSGTTYERFSLGAILDDSEIPQGTLDAGTFDLSFDRLRFEGW